MPLAAALALALAADHPRVQLRYQLDGGARCLSAAQLGAEVEARLGYDPFAAGAPLVADVRIAPSGQGFEATLTLSDAQGHPRGRQRLSSPVADCRELEASLALALALAIDPGSLQRPLPRTVYAPAPVPPPAAAQPLPPHAPPPRAPLSFGLSLGGGAGLGAAPGLVGTVDLGLELRRPRWSVSVGGLATSSGGTAADGGTVSAALYAGDATGCARLGWLGLCGELAAGAEVSTAEGLPAARVATTPYLALGGRLQADIPLWSRFFLRPHVDALVPLLAASIDVGAAGAETRVWAAAAVDGSLGVDLLALVP
ncbi:MAG TPA: hypothetical protein VMB50_03465 [Myxococcales bacterium]|nr:hypothetical protein [Myxococcales bacterium]